MRSNENIEQVMQAHGSAVWRVCLLYFPSKADAEDAFQDTFIKYAQADEQVFSDSDHVRAWLLRVAMNTCKDMLRAARRSELPLGDDLEQTLPDDDSSAAPGSRYSEVVDAMRSLPDPPRTPLYLALCEQWTAPEIAAEMDVPVNTVYSWISRGKKALKEALS